MHDADSRVLRMFEFVMRIDECGLWYALLSEREINIPSIPRVRID
jgi:hypothetical protein